MGGEQFREHGLSLKPLLLIIHIAIHEPCMGGEINDNPLSILKVYTLVYTVHCTIGQS